MKRQREDPDTAYERVRQREIDENPRTDLHRYSAAGTGCVKCGAKFPTPPPCAGANDHALRP